MMLTKVLCLVAAVGGAFALPKSANDTYVAPKHTTPENHMDPSPFVGLEPLVLNTTEATCDPYYDVFGGCREQYQGRYQRMSEAFQCNGHSVFENAAAGYYMIKTAQGNWMVTSRATMESCGNTGWLSSGVCTCPESCADTTWLGNTGTDNTGQCNAPVWCYTGVWVR